MTRSFTVDDVAQHNTQDSIWIIVHDKVYDVTNFLNEHPGGKK
ncbi:28027_t:CDS:1, partial [Racocetra persica]